MLSPKAVAICSYGCNQQWARRFDDLKKKLRGQAGAGQEKAPLVRYDDLRESLGDPRWARGAERSRHEEDGTFEQTIIAVYQSCQMASVVDSALMEFVQDAGMVEAALWLLECWTGYHRSDVVGRTFKSVLNNMKGPEGDRLFNAEFFPLACCRHMGEAMDRIEQAQYWLEHPWTLSPTTEWHSAYAHDATIRNKSAFDTFTKVWQSRTKANEVICSHLTGTTGDHTAQPSPIPEQEEDTDDDHPHHNGCRRQQMSRRGSQKGSGHQHR